MAPGRRLGPAVDIPPAFIAGGPAVSDLKQLAIAQELRERVEEALARAETFHDPECKRPMRQNRCGLRGSGEKGGRQRGLNGPGRSTWGTAARRRTKT